MPTPSPLFNYPKSFTYFTDTIKARDAKIAKAKADKIAKIKAEKQRAAQLAAQATRISLASPPVYQAPQAPTTVSNCGDNQYAHFIYEHESGCSTTATNAGGCLGIGQACPGSKLLAVCPTLSYSCENAFFTNYANSTYGGWGGAYSTWLAKGWW